MAEIRRDGEQAVFEIDQRERQALIDIVERIEPMISRSRWVNHPAYDDGEKEAEFQRLVGQDLEEARRGDLEAMRRDLSGELPVRLGRDQAWSWLRALNFLRLALADQLGIEADGWEDRYSTRQHRRPPLATLHLLSWLQEEMVDVLGEP